MSTQHEGNEVPQSGVRVSNPHPPCLILGCKGRPVDGHSVCVDHLFDLGPDPQGDWSADTFEQPDSGDL